MDIAFNIRLRLIKNAAAVHFFWNVYLYFCCASLPSVLWHCRLASERAFSLLKVYMMISWTGYLSEARCKLFASGLADASAIIWIRDSRVGGPQYQMQNLGQAAIWPCGVAQTMLLLADIRHGCLPTAGRTQFWSAIICKLSRLQTVAARLEAFDMWSLHEILQILLYHSYYQHICQGSYRLLSSFFSYSREMAITAPLFQTRDTSRFETWSPPCQRWITSTVQSLEETARMPVCHLAEEHWWWCTDCQHQHPLSIEEDRWSCD